MGDCINRKKACEILNKANPTNPYEYTNKGEVLAWGGYHLI